MWDVDHVSIVVRELMGLTNCYLFIHATIYRIMVNRTFCWVCQDKSLQLTIESW